MRSLLVLVFVLAGWHGASAAPGQEVLFFDGFESGDLSAWDNPTWITTEVTPEHGGELHDPASGLTLSVPPGAVSSPLRLRAWRQATVEADPVAGVLAELDEHLRALHAYRFEPAGHVFALPVHFALPVPAGSLAGGWTVFMLEHATTTWGMLTVAPGTARAGSVDAAGRTAAFELDRLGTFAAMAPPLPPEPPGPLRAGGNVCAVVTGWSFVPAITSVYGVSTSSCPTGMPCQNHEQCDDGDPCTDDLCLSDQCVNLDKFCFDNNVCTYDFCDPLLGCNPPDPTMNGQPCIHGDLCIARECQDGVCLPIGPVDCDPCKECVGGDCLPIDCDDEDPCTIDTCVGGKCVHGPMVCDPCEECVGGDCLPIDCDDKDPCTIDTCVGGKCVHGPMVCDPCEECVDGDCLPIDCDDGDPCTIDTCVGGRCVHGPMICDDDDACTDDSCVGGNCKYEPITCPPDTVCVLGICIPDPTFIVPLDPGAPPSGRAGLALPFAPSLLRGEIPLSVELPVGSFFAITVEDADGEQVFSCRGKVERPFEPSFLDRLVAAGKTPEGNACNWDAGLAAYSYGERYGPHSDVATGLHTLSLDALTPQGVSVRDRLEVVVADVLTFVWGGRASSADGRVALEVGEHALEEPFQLVAIHADGEASGRRVYYRILSSRRRFLRPARLTVQPPAAAIHLATDPADRDTWRQVAGESSAGFEAQLLELPAGESYLLLDDDGDGSASSAAGAAESVDAARTLPDAAATSGGDVVLGGDVLLGGDLVLDDAAGLGAAVPRDRRHGARLDLVEHCPAPPCLRLRNPAGGNLGTSLWRGELELRAYPRLSIDLRLDPELSLGLLARVDGHWYELTLAGEPESYRRAGITSLGRAQGAVADGRWHRVTLDLLQRLRRADRITPRSAARLEEVMLARFRAPGYLQLAPAELPAGAQVHVDRLVFHHRSPVHGNAAPANAAPANADAAAENHAGERTPAVAAAPVVTRTSEWTTFSSSPRSVLEFAVDAGRLDFTYRTSEAHGFAGAYARPEVRDWRAFDVLRFETRQLAGETRWSLGVRDGDEHQSSVRAASYLPDEPPTGWRTLTVPLAAFSRVDLADVRQLVVAADGAPGPPSQRVQVRRLELLTLGADGPADLVLGRFATGMTAWGEAPSTFHSAGAEVAVVSTTRGQVLAVGGVRSQRFRESWAGWTAPLPGVDARSYGSLELRLRRLSGALAVNLKLEDGDGGELVVPLAELAQDTAEWQILRLPLPAAGDAEIDLSDLRAAVLAFEGSSIDGALLVDRLRLRR